jgi:PfaD family protein
VARLLIQSESSQTTVTGARRLGWWTPGVDGGVFEPRIEDAVQRIGRPLHVVVLDDEVRVSHDGVAILNGIANELGDDAPPDGLPLVAFVPALRPEQFGDAAFRSAHGVRFAYIAGEMANGIGSVEMVEAMGRAGMLGFFGAAGLMPDRVESAMDRIQRTLGDRPYGFNLIHSPAEPRLEAAVADLYLRRGARVVSASAYLDLTLPLVRYRVRGIRELPDGRVAAPNRIIAKVSRVEVATKFLSPPPEALLRPLVETSDITAAQARMAATIPMAEDLTAEADSGGHTDNRPLVTLLPTMLALRDRLQTKYGYERPPRVGAAGGIATPESAAAAFAMGAAYVLTGSVNQACLEAGTSAAVKQMLAAAEQADVIMAPAADMFEMGVRVQVLKRGTMFAMRARKLYDLYRAYEGLESLPAAERAALERDFFRGTLEQAWEQTSEFFTERDPSQVRRGERDAKHRMALVFRSYLGQSSNWANSGEPSRRVDYQIWCGPAMGAFNEWTHGTFLEKPERRDVVTVATNLMVGAAALTRAMWLRAQGVALPAEALHFAPRTLDELSDLVS